MVLQKVLTLYFHDSESRYRLNKCMLKIFYYNDKYTPKTFIVSQIFTVLIELELKSPLFTLLFFTTSSKSLLNSSVQFYSAIFVINFLRKLQKFQTSYNEDLLLFNLLPYNISFYHGLLPGH